MNERDRDAPDRASLARDHLANERTYLAWLRTAAAVMALGLAIAGFGDATTATRVVASGILVLTGASGVFYGTMRYRQVIADLEAGRFRPGQHGRAAMIASTVLVLAVLVAVVTLFVGRN